MKPLQKFSSDKRLVTCRPRPPEAGNHHCAPAPYQASDLIATFNGMPIDAQVLASPATAGIYGLAQERAQMLKTSGIQWNDVPEICTGYRTASEQTIKKRL